MSERDLEARLDAVERALADGDTDLSDLHEASGLVDDLQSLETRLDTVERRLDELEAGLEAVRGYAGNVRAVNREVERRASAALAKAETVEAAVESDSRPQDRADPGHVEGDTGRDDRIDHGDYDDHGDTADRPSARRPSGQPVDAADPDRNRTEPSSRDHDARRQCDGEHQRGDRREPDSGRQRDGDRHRGRSTKRNGGEHRQPDRSVAVDEERSRGGGSSEATAESDSDRDSQTEQFIERVRDAL